MKIVIVVTMKPSILALFRKFIYNGLWSMIVSPKYTRKKVSRTQKAEDVSSIVLSALFWRSAREIVNVCTPILHVLRLADREGATMGFIYELTDRIIEKIGKLDGIDNVILEEVKALCIGRWNMLHSPIHVAAYILHPV
ncbi:hypothetical protein KP509_08G002800 [Ceratopteris richardii]|uniref:Uncharacterized protein n=1 Tax=Ceratopteris richardii TaxID=49495 RepID=A0A8T2U769_CERRI|nr:hypothetical protein KP509_08G002800 [Ceratopteris richardii]